MSSFEQIAYEDADLADVCARRVFEDMSITPAAEKLLSQTFETDTGEWSVMCSRCGQCALINVAQEGVSGADCTTA